MVIDALPIDTSLIAGRYRRVRFLAMGGMGEVWEAFDEELKQRVALKILRRDIAADPVALERFKREITLARRVAHSNVCRIFEFGRHQDGEGAVTFLTMELLEGPTLERRILEGGAVPPAEALSIAAQLCEGLAAAHEAGVVHRDLKSANVILAKRADLGTRVVITDFGLARAVSGDGADAITLTSHGLLVGTPAYMSPEQAEGAPLTSRSDQYSLGVVLYEMVTGRLPHGGDTPLAVLLSRLKGPAPSPLSVMPALDERWDAVIRRCLEVRPERRFESARDVATALRGEVVAPPPESVEPAPVARDAARPAPRRGARFAGAILLVGVAAALAVFFLRKGADPSRGARRSAAVLGLKNLSGRPDTAWLSTALSEMLTAELAAGEQIRTIPGETVARAKADLALADSDSLAPATQARLNALLGSDLLVTGSYVAGSAEQDAPLRVDLHVTGRDGIDAVLSETGTPGQVIALAASLGTKVRDRLGMAGAAEASHAGARAAFPESPAAQRDYAEGLARLRTYDFVEARTLLEKAAEEAPKNPRIRSALASCFTALGDDARARDAAQAAFDAREELPREDRLLMEAQLAEARNEWTKAIEDYRALHRFFPDDVEHTLRLATAQISSRSSTEALETLQKSPVTSDPRITFGIGRAQFALAQYPESLASARRVITLAAQSGARLLLARARMLEAGALLRAGNHRQAAASCEIARAIFAAAGDRVAEAEALNRLANILFDEGRYAGARAGFERAEATWRAAGNSRGAARALANVADVDLMTGALARATPLFEEALRTFESVDDVPEASLQLVNIGYLRYAAGDLRGALENVEKGLAMGRTTGVMHSLHPGLITRAQYELSLGRTTDARRDAETVLGSITAAGDLRYLGYVHQTLGDVARAVGDLKRARDEYERGLAARRESAAGAEMVESLGALGDLCRDEGRPAEGLDRLREAARQAHSLSLPDEEMTAEARLTRCALAAGLHDESRRAAGLSAALASQTEHLPKRLLAEIASGEFGLADGDVAGARTTLERVREKARRSGLALLEGEARLVLGQLAIAAGDRNGGRTQLLGLAREAESSGLLLLSRKAQALAR